ncbi:ABC transporter ATP-binding protein [Haloarcula halophila]|uniref:ABC transporter ATP-binding protein n=1 Tax=Haloarcula TaxID=2237 RepID=UPI0023E3E5D2|nr:ABC transporter ATP-binding protein [Halomicroarcula sp. DFY41]
MTLEHPRPNETESGGSKTARNNESTADSGIVEGEELVLSYPTGDEPVIDGEYISATAGKVTALVGPNGSGKSTLLKGLADQLSPDSGTVRVDGRAVQSFDKKEFARTLGLLSQESTSPDGITVEDLVYHGRYPHRGFFEGTTEDDEQAVDRAIELAGCGHLRDREVGQLSGGQKQLAWIAMVLAQDTDVLLLDEPTTFLDLHHQLEVMEIIETLREESDITIVVVLHDIEQAARLADEMVAIGDGEIQARGRPDEVVTEELLADVFEIDAEVEQTPRGPRIEPLRARHEGDQADSHAD